MNAPQQLLFEISTDPLIEQSIAVASPSLHQSLKQMHGSQNTPRDREKITASLLSYLIRMSTRPTPFGLFSGVALGFFGEETTLQLGNPAISRFRSRPDMEWLDTIIKQIEADPAIITQLAVQTNPLAYFVGNRALLAWPSTSGQNQITSLRATSVVRHVFKLAESPLSYLALCDELLRAFPKARGEQIEKVLSHLLVHGLLIPILSPPLTHSEPLLYVSEQLKTVQGAEPLRQRLECILVTSIDLETTDIERRMDKFSKLIHLQHTLGGSKKPQPAVQVDSQLSVQSPMLVSRIGAIAAQAALLLLRLTPAPTGSASLKEYRSLFLETYSENAEVPLLELLSPERGLDAPPGYTWPVRLSHANVPNLRLEY